MAEIAEPKRHSLLVNLVIRLVKEKPLGTVGGVIFLAMFFNLDGYRRAGSTTGDTRFGLKKGRHRLKDSQKCRYRR